MSITRCCDGEITTVLVFNGYCCKSHCRCIAAPVIFTEGFAHIFNVLLTAISCCTSTESVVCGDHQFSLCRYRLSETLSSACCYLTVDNLKEYITSSTDENTVKTLSWEEDFVQRFTPYLESNYSALQLAAYRLLLK